MTDNVSRNRERYLPRRVRAVVRDRAGKLQSHRRRKSAGQAEEIEFQVRIAGERVGWRRLRVAGLAIRPDPRVTVVASNE